jgi:hypothetical protein
MKPPGQAKDDTNTKRERIADGLEINGGIVLGETSATTETGVT